MNGKQVLVFPKGIYTYFYFVPKSRVPFGQYHESRPPLGRSNTGSSRFKDSPVTLSMLMLRLQNEFSAHDPKLRVLPRTFPEVAILGAGQ